jgi:hypothetical protein
LALPPHGDSNDDDAAGPPLVCGSSAEAAAFELAALIIA